MSELTDRIEAAMKQNLKLERNVMLRHSANTVERLEAEVAMLRAGISRIPAILHDIVEDYTSEQSFEHNLSGSRSDIKHLMLAMAGDIETEILQEFK